MQLTFILQQIADEAAVTDLMALQKISLKLFVRLCFNISTAFVLINYIYYKNYKRSDLFFTFYLFNLVIFLICFLLNKVDLSMGAAFGLFAVFSMLRYRTEDISIKDMSYLFLLIALGLLNAVTKIKGADDFYEYIFLFLINVLIIVVAFVLESSKLISKELCQIITYEKIELIKQGREEELKNDLIQKTGLNIKRFEISKLDFIRDSAQIKIYYTI